jgi:hypothetical protein
MTGKSGSTHGARMVSTPERKDIIISDIRKCIKKIIVPYIRHFTRILI